MSRKTAESKAALARLSETLNALSLSGGDRLETIVAGACGILGGSCALYHRMDDRGNLKVAAACTAPDDLEPFFEPQGHICWEATMKQDNTPVVIPDIEDTPYFETDPHVRKYGLKAYIGFPVVSQGQVVGALCVVDSRKRSFTEDETHCIKSLAAAVSLEEERMALDCRLKQIEKMELVASIAGGVAHDLNNILSGLVSYPELLVMQLPEDSFLKEPISFMHQAGLKAADIVQDLLTLTRRGYTPESVLNFNTLINEYFNSPGHHRLINSYPQISFHLSEDPELLNIWGSATHVTKIIMNLVINAVEAVSRDGNVWIETANQYLDTPLKGYDHVERGDYAVLRIRDDGPGMSPLLLEKIFEPFVTHKAGGTGLGLCVVKNTVADHQGYLCVESAEGEGSCFEVFFPATREKAEDDTRGFDIRFFRADREKVLVVDDIHEQRKIARDCLEILNYTSFCVSSGEKAVEFLKDHKVDLVLLDMGMPLGMDGYQTFREIVRQNPSQRVVIASGFSEDTRVKATLSLGKAQYVKKPYTVKNLARVLKKTLEI